MPREDALRSDPAAPTLRSEEVSIACASASLRRAPEVQIVEASPASGVWLFARAARQVTSAASGRASRPGMLGQIGRVLRAVGSEARTALAAAARSI